MSPLFFAKFYAPDDKGGGDTTPLDPDELSQEELQRADVDKNDKVVISPVEKEDQIPTDPPDKEEKKEEPEEKVDKEKESEDDKEVDKKDEKKEETPPEKTDDEKIEDLEKAASEGEVAKPVEFEFAPDDSTAPRLEDY